VSVQKQRTRRGSYTTTGSTRLPSGPDAHRWKVFSRS
jgi:hypothetical protein